MDPVVVPVFASSIFIPPLTSTEDAFSTCAINPELSMTEPMELVSLGRAGSINGYRDQVRGLQSASRRGFLKIFALTTAAAAVPIGVMFAFSDYAVGQRMPPSPQESKALPFPKDIPVPLTAQEHTHIQTLIEGINAKVKQYQENLFHFEPNGKLSVRAKSMTDHLGRINTLYEDLAQIILEKKDAQGPVLITEMENKGWISRTEGKVFRSRLTHLSAPGPDLNFFFQQFLPNYFAHYGFYFIEQYIAANGLPLPVIQIRQVLKRTPKAVPLAVFGGKKELIQVYELEASRVRTFHQWDARFPYPATFHTRPYTDQVFMDKSHAIDRVKMNLNFDLNLLKQYHAKSQLITSAETKDPVRRAAMNMVIMSWEDNHPQHRMPTSAEYEGYLTDLLITSTLKHEAVHVHDRNIAFPHTKEATTLIEIRGAVGSAIDLPHVKYLTASIFGQSLLPIEPMGEHGIDFLFMRNRLGYWLWQDKALREKLTKRNAGILFPTYDKTIHQFIELPISIQEAVFSAFPFLSAKELWDLYKRIWEEIQSNDNPVTRGYEIQTQKVIIGEIDFGEPVLPVRKKPLISLKSLLSESAMGILGWVVQRRIENTVEPRTKSISENRLLKSAV
jgi:hypothetical protein